MRGGVLSCFNMRFSFFTFFRCNRCLLATVVQKTRRNVRSTLKHILYIVVSPGSNCCTCLDVASRKTKDQERALTACCSSFFMVVAHFPPLPPHFNNNPVQKQTGSVSRLLCCVLGENTAVRVGCCTDMRKQKLNMHPKRRTDEPGTRNEKCKKHPNQSINQNAIRQTGRPAASKPSVIFCCLRCGNINILSYTLRIQAVSKSRNKVDVMFFL